MAEFLGSPERIADLIREHDTARDRAIKAAIPSAIRTGVEIVKKNTPVGMKYYEDAEGFSHPGRLRESVHQEQDDRIVVDAPYAGFVELGTWRMEPRLFVAGSLPELLAQLGVEVADRLK